MRRATTTVLALLLAAVCAGAGEHPWDGKRIYYVIEYQGRLRERGFFVRRPGSWQRSPCVVTEEEKFTFAGGDPSTPSRSVRIRTVSTPTGEAIQRREEAIIGEPGQETINVAGGEAIFEATGYLGRPARLPVPPGVLFEVTGEWLASRQLRRGASHQAQLIDRPGRSVTIETVDVLEQLSPASGGNPSVWLAEFTSPGRPPMRARFTSDGRLTRLESEGLVYQVVGREDYEFGRIPAETATVPVPAPSPIAPQPASLGGPAIPIGQTVPAWDNFAWLIFRAGPSGQWDSVIQPSEYSQIDYQGVDTVITALRNAPRVDAAAAFPMPVPPEVQPYLSPRQAIPALDPAVMDAAYNAVADSEGRREQNVLRAVSYLAGWIHQNIALLPWVGPNGSALDALASRSGDAVAQARLFAAMARSLGVPTRICQGLLAQTGQATPHAWAEAWLNGVWIPVDSTVSRVGLPAGYVLAERAGPDGMFAGDFANFLRRPGLTLTLVSAGRETPGRQLAELIVGDRRTYAVSEGDWLANLYWGFALRLPPSWSGSARLDSVELTSPDGRASVKCEALSGDYGAGKADLDAAVSGLRSSQRRFRAVDSRVVSFDAEGATPALFIDFTTLRDGQNLRCRQYLLPRRQRAFRISFWAPTDNFSEYSAAFDSILASFEY